MAADFLPLAAAVSAAGLLIAVHAGLVAVATASRLRAAEDPEERVLSQLQLSRRAKQLALYDEATGLYQDWYLKVRLDEEAARCRRYGLSMAVILISVGRVELHAFASGEWLRRTAEAAHVIAASIRAVDMAARLGPSELALCLVHCDRTGAERALARITAAMGADEPRVGLAVYPEDNCESDALIDLARGRAGLFADSQAA